MTHVLPTTDSPLRCSQCNSELVMVKTVTEKPDGAMFAQTTTTYRCSNKSCQEEKDRQVAKRAEITTAKEERMRDSALRRSRDMLLKKLEKSEKQD